MLDHHAGDVAMTDEHDDAQNLRLFEKLARRHIDDGTDAADLLDSFMTIYELGKAVGCLEQTDAELARLDRQLGEIPIHG